jgi:hypothetical protein
MPSTVACVSGAAALVAIALTGCASTDYHYSQLLGNRYYRAPIDTYPVSVVRVDGKDNTRSPALVDPGVREVSVQGPPGGAGGFGEVRTISLSVAPCTRYYLVAVKSQTLASDFTVRVEHQEPVAGCTPPRSS